MTEMMLNIWLQFFSTLDLCDRNDFKLFLLVNLAILYLYLQFLDKQQEDIDDDLDYMALENGFVSWRISFIFKHAFHWAATIYAVKFIYFL